ncbi:MAG: putative lipopolysaccharide heptosyltransferase III [Nitrospirae bacterium]|nr:MAG: putative lipopolysaccharide heptosyltransferase III [Nitrospirota bacterium]
MKSCVDSPLSRSCSNILVIKLRYIGDVVLTTPLLHDLRVGLPHARLTVLVNPGTEDVLRHNPDVTQVLCLPRSSVLECLRFYHAIRVQGFDCVIDLTDGDRSALLTFVTGAPLRIGFNREGRIRGRFYSRCIRAAYGEMHMLDYHALVLPVLGLSTRSGPPIVPLSQEDHQRAQRLLESCGLAHRRWIMVHPAARYRFKAWAPERFARLSDGLITLGYQVVLVGASHEKPVAEEVQRHATHRLVSLVGATRLLDLAALMTRCAVFVGNDAGPLHIAAAVGCPVVGLFGPSNPAVWGPRGGNRIACLYKGLDCRACFYPGCFRGEASCMNLISVDEVMSAVMDFLKDGS